MDNFDSDAGFSEEGMLSKYGIQDYHYLTYDNNDNRKSLILTIRKHLGLILTLIAVTLLLISIFVLLITIKTPVSEHSIHHYYNRSCLILQQKQDQSWTKIDLCRMLPVLAIFLVATLIIISLIIWAAFVKSPVNSNDRIGDNTRYQLLTPNIMKQRLPANPFRRINQCYSQGEMEIE